MATKLFRGDAPILRQVTTLTPGGTIEVGDRFLVTINGKTVVYAATGTTVASVCTGLAAELEASTIPEFEEIEWTDGVAWYPQGKRILRPSNHRVPRENQVCRPGRR